MSAEVLIFNEPTPEEIRVLQATVYKGDEGDSAYQVAVTNGFDGTQEEWLASLVGDKGKDAYQSYLDTTDDNPVLTEAEWSSIYDTKENIGVAQSLITQLIDGASIGGNTLKRLEDRLLTTEAIIGNAAGDDDNLINTIREVLAVFSNFPEGSDMTTLLSAKVNVTDIYNGVDCIVAGKVLDARIGKTLNDNITAVNSSAAKLAGGNTFTGSQIFDTNTLFVDSVNHRVGMGTTTPETILDIYSATGAFLTLGGGGNYDNGITFEEAGLDYFQILHQASAGASPDNLFKIRSASINDGIIDRDIMTFKQNGNIGIGTSTIPHNLTFGATSSVIGLDTVDGSDNKRLLLSSTGGLSRTRGSYIMLCGNEYTDSNYHGDIRVILGDGDANTNKGDFIVTTAVGDVFYVLNNGNVGIGISPTAPFEVLSQSAAIAKFSRASSSGVSINADGSGVYFATTGTHNFRIFTNSTEKVRVDSNGNVGIGTVSPVRKVDILNNVAGESFLLRLSNNNNASGDIATLEFETKRAGTSKFIQLQALATTATFGMDFAIKLADSVDSTLRERVRITSAGNVGIGTSDPTSQLAVSYGSTSNSNGITIVNTIGKSFRLTAGIQGISNDGFQIYDATANVARLVISSAGNIGIGTTDALTRLHVAAPTPILRIDSTTADADGTLQFFDFVSGGTSGFIRAGNNAGNDYLVIERGATAGVDRIGLYADNSIRFLTNSVEKLRITAAGNVGVGFTSPASKFHTVIGNNVAKSSLFSSSDWVTGTTGSGLLIKLNTDTGNTQSVLQAYINGSNAYGDIVLQASGGNVGIGTISPTSRIHGVATLAAATGNEIAFRLDYTTNKATSGNDTGLLISMTDTASPGTSLLLDLQVGGASRLSVSASGSLVTQGNLYGSVSSYLGWNENTVMRCHSNGNIALYNWATSGFGRIQLGGETSAFPAIKRSNTDIHIVTANDGGFTGLRAGEITASLFKVAALNSAPASASDTGTANEVRFTNDGIYICIATNTWIKAIATTW